MTLDVLVLGLNYAPEPTGIAPYTSGMVSGLRNRGHQVSVVTTFPHYPAWRVDEGFSGWRRHESVDGISVTRMRHYVPRQPSPGKRVMSELSFGARLLFAEWGAPDVVVCPSPALFSTALAAVRATSGRSRPAFGVIVQDLYASGVGETGQAGRRTAQALSRVEGWVLRQADGVSVIHDRFKRRVVESFNVPAHRVEVIRNWAHVPSVGRFDREGFRRWMGWGDETIVLHTGAMGEKQGLANVVAAGRAAERAGAPLRFVLVGQGSQRAELERVAHGCRAVEIRDPLPNGAYARALRAADILLVNERPGVKEMAVPSKLTSYFSAGIAVLAATEEDSTTAEEVAASGAGVRVGPGDPEALVAAALHLRGNRELSTELGSRGPAYCAKVLSEASSLDAYEAWMLKLHHRRHEGYG